MSALPRAGWYPDPAGSGSLRWWDGSAWTDYVSQPDVAGDVHLSATPSQPSASAPLSPAPASEPSLPAGWYRDVEGSSDGATLERWWDGSAWTRQYRRFVRSDRLLPDALSWPVLLCAPAILFALLGTLLSDLAGFSLSVLVAAVTAVPLIGAFVWLDRLEPEPWQERVHALLWGATVPVAFALLLGFPLGLLSDGSMLVSMVVGAPFSEELGKGLGVLFVLRRHRVDTTMDGVVYAGWVAAGFAIVEDVLYYTSAYETAGLPGLLGTGVMRGLVSMFAHPLMTFPIGLAVGWAVSTGRSPVRWAAAGYVPAVALHALWNFSAASGALLLVYALFLAPLFLVTVAILYRIRQRGRDVLSRQVPLIAEHYGLTAQEADSFSSWERKLAVRRSLPRSSRPAFDRLHAAVSRLAQVQDRGVPVPPEHHRRLVEGLWEARAAL